MKEIDHQKNNKLLISYIGFKPQELSINDLKDPVIIEMEYTEKYFSLKYGLEKILGRSVDLLEERSDLNPVINIIQIL